MYKVIIIDDEEIIVEGMKMVLPWEKYNCEVVATACDGVSGLAEIQKHNPHILFTDICMPNMDGLAMLNAIKSEFPNLQTAILTGYHDFAYAQEAIRLGVVRLLTKPSRMEELVDAIQTMTNNLKNISAIQEQDKGTNQVANSFIVKQALEYLEEQYPNKITLQMVADHCYVSQWHLSKLLNKHTNQSFYDLLNSIRIRHAKELLADPKLRMADIGELVGYLDPAHFSRTFKKLEGISANEYRNKF